MSGKFKSIVGVEFGIGYSRRVVVNVEVGEYSKVGV